jgi:hypothetical protein
MRFCSPDCRTAYRERLDDDTKAKIKRLDLVVPATSQNPARGWLGSVIGRLPRHFS